ncbi:thiopurine S-methyltransferase [Marinospirillum sp. MEB164]|uniref:Thiopurine S-methyltransferase n=1 Tax=Marinospirillum alkalitolerans TaxID=3123374 RepID=A0ABW8PW58_9GAMM
MDRSYWEKVWREEDLGFHQPQVNRHLQRFWQRLQLAPEARVFVPLCGKSLDLDWLLSEGHEVIGIDLAEQAQQAVLARHSAGVRYAQQSHLHLAWQERLLFVVGDVFHLKADLLRSVDAVYDRAALVALPTAVRENYALFLAQCLKPGAQILLVAREEAARLQGPPFSVNTQEVERLYGANFAIECLAEEVRSDQVVERVFLLVRHQPWASGYLPVEAQETQAG